jgi:hypothetical protein
VSGFPTVLYLNGNSFYEFRGDRNAEGLRKFIFEKGYLEAENDVIPQKLQGMALY